MRAISQGLRWRDKRDSSKSDGESSRLIESKSGLIPFIAGERDWSISVLNNAQCVIKEMSS